MRVRRIAPVFALLLGVAACGGSTSTPASPTATTMTPTSSSPSGTPTVTGTWVGAAADSGGGMMGMSSGAMGMGMASSSLGNMTWQMTQTGSTFTGTAGFAGYHGTSPMLISGTMNGKSGTFTMTLPTGSMPTAGCSGQVAGTFDMDDMMAKMTGSYSGSATCSGPFSNGQMTMTKG
jgi:hypothetical protein